MFSFSRKSLAFVKILVCFRVLVLVLGLRGGECSRSPQTISCLVSRWGDLLTLQRLVRPETIRVDGEPLDGTNIADLTALGALVGLRRLAFRWRYGSLDLSPLSDLTELRWLDLSGCTDLHIRMHTYMHALPTYMHTLHCMHTCVHALHTYTRARMHIYIHTLHYTRACIPRMYVIERDKNIHGRDN